MSLLVVVFFLELALYLITTVGAKPINELVSPYSSCSQPKLSN
jgi:hypothetical protein